MRRRKLLFCSRFVRRCQYDALHLGCLGHCRLRRVAAKLVTASAYALLLQLREPG